MDEIIVQIARALACVARLRILSSLASVHETPPTALSAGLNMPMDGVCDHLRRLSSAGLIRRRRSGVWCYCVAQSPYSDRTVSGRIAAWLFDMLKRPANVLKDCGVGQAGGLSAAEQEAQLHRVLFEAATAFTNVRRLQILRRLVRGDVVNVETLTRELSMSESAVSRHTAKLIRRGYVQVAVTGRLLAYRLASAFRTPVHARLFEIVRGAWKRSSTSGGA